MAEVDVGAHALVGEALHEQTVAVVLEPLVAGDVFLVADALAFAPLDDAPAHAGRERQAPIEGGGFGQRAAGCQHGRGRQHGGRATAEGRPEVAMGTAAKIHGVTRWAA